jgi:hypothetical protein
VVVVVDLARQVVVNPVVQELPIQLLELLLLTPLEELEAVLHLAQVLLVQTILAMVELLVGIHRPDQMVDLVL